MSSVYQRLRMLISQHLPDSLGEQINDQTELSLPVSEQIQSWYLIVTPNNLCIPWRGNEIYFYSFDEVQNMQLLYQNSFSWDTSWFVIGEIGGNPIIINDSIKNPVFLAHHGEGNWNLKPISGNFEEFLEFLCVWIHEIAFISDDFLVDEDGELPHKTKQFLISRLKEFMKSEHVENVIYFLEEVIQTF